MVKKRRKSRRSKPKTSRRKTSPRRISHKKKPEVKVSDKNLIIIGGAIVIIVAIAIFLTNSNPSTNALSSGSVETYTRACLPGTEEKSPTTCLPDSMFRDLPPVPNDFWPVMTLIRAGRVADMCGKIDESYWKQPEMLPTFYTTGVPSMITPPEGEVVMGWGAYPGEVIGGVNAKGDNVIRSCFFIMASWQVSRYQGMSLQPVYPGNAAFLENSFSDGSKNVEQDPEMNREYFTITTTPKNVLLEPAWGYFYNGWIQKIDVTITVNPETPPGKYIIGVNPTGPPKELDQEWLWEYKTLYVPIGGFGLDRPFYTIGVEVS